MLNEWIAERGYQITFSRKKGRYFQGMMRLLADDLAVFRDPAFIKLFEDSALRKGKPYRFQELRARCQVRGDTAIRAFGDRFRQLIAQAVFLRGLQLACPACDLETWYALDQVRESIVCVGCRAPFPLPLEVDFVFRLNQLFLAGLNEGASSVLLTLDRLAPEEALLCLNLSRGGHVDEIDVIAWCDGRVIIAECKDHWQGDILPQLTRVHALSEQLGADQFVFATLAESIPFDLPGATLWKRSDLLTG
ncbi:MAG: hypothetical protein MUF87_14325 [Anaerolineae bacterium]|jgi:hypothetical protein|nr:hypothetical protein [Anaerolineae bacterium]